MSFDKLIGYYRAGKGRREGEEEEEEAEEESGVEIDGQLAQVGGLRIDGGWWMVGDGWIGVNCDENLITVQRVWEGHGHGLNEG